MARVFTSKKSKAGKKIACKKCGRKIKAGEKYFYYTRKLSRSKKVRGVRFTHCADHRPRHTDLSGSPMAEIYDAQEDASGSLDSCLSGSDMMQVIEDLKAVVEEVKERAEESLENMPEGLRENSDSGQTLQERIDALEEYISELEQVEVGDAEEIEEEEPEEGEEPKGEAKELDKEDPVEEAREECRQAIDSLSL